VLDAEKAIDRKQLGALVFSDPKELAKLNAIVHPRMKGMMRELGTAANAKIAVKRQRFYSRSLKTTWRTVVPLLHLRSHPNESRNVAVSLRIM
jgi:dephospho-CoA kinase